MQIEEFFPMRYKVGIKLSKSGAGGMSSGRNLDLYLQDHILFPTSTSNELKLSHHSTTTLTFQQQCNTGRNAQRVGGVNMKMSIKFKWLFPELCFLPERKSTWSDLEFQWFMQGLPTSLTHVDTRVCMCACS